MMCESVAKDDGLTGKSGDPDTERGSRSGVTEGGSAKTVLFVANKLSFVINHRLHLLERMIAEGYRITVVGMGGKNDQAVFTEIGASVSPLEIDQYAFNPTADMRWTFALRRIICDVEPDIVHFITIKPITYGRLALIAARLVSRFSPSVVVSTFAGLGRVFADAGGFGAALRKIIVSTMLRIPVPGKAEFATVENQADKDELCRHRVAARRNIVVVRGTGIDTNLFSPRPRTGPVRFLFAGRLIKAKGADLFIDAARTVLGKGLECTFIIAGPIDPDDPNSISFDDLEAARAVDGIDFAGEVDIDAMPDIIRSVDVVCLPTRYREGIPRILLEAAACGKSFIASRQPGWVDIVGQTPSTGWILDDLTETELCRAFEAAAGDPDQTRQMGAAARDLILNASVSHADVQETVLQIYRQAS